MSETPPETPEAENVRAIRQLVRLMERYDLTAIDLIEGSTKIRLRRRGPEAASPSAGPVPVAYVPTQAPTQSPASPPPTPAAPKGIVIESPMVGTFYASNSPDLPPFVSVGSPIRPETTVCVIEAMKVFTDIPAGVGGTIAEVLVKAGESVEFGQPLFRVTPT